MYTCVIDIHKDKHSLHSLSLNPSNVTFLNDSSLIITIFCNLDTTVSIERTPKEHIYVNASVPKTSEKPVSPKRKCVRHSKPPAYPDAAAAPSTPAESNQETPYEVMSISKLVTDSDRSETVQGATAMCTVSNTNSYTCPQRRNERVEKHKLSTFESCTERPSTLEFQNLPLLPDIQKYTVEKITRNTAVSNSHNF